MSHNRNRNTGPEMTLRRALWRSGLRYRLGRGRKLPGNPDVVFVSSRLAIFVDGCFWHGCPVHATQPGTNTEFWQRKLDGNKQRDQRVNARLGELGWTVLRLWEHEVKRNVNECVGRVARLVSSRAAAHPGGA